MKLVKNMQQTVLEVSKQSNNFNLPGIGDNLIS